MRLLELSIRNIRGIPDLTLKPDGRNLVICGPNGSGKSSVLDAIDFLFTGRISRLVGRGTGGITLQEHGVNLNAANNLENSVVSGRIQLHDGTIVELQRSISNSSELGCRGYDLDAMNDLLRSASNGQHILTRQRILQYITEQPKDRAEKIQALLGLSNLEDVRSSLVKVKNSLDKEFDKALVSYQAIRGQIGALLESLEWNDNNILEFINKQRRVLGEAPIEKLTPQDVRRDMSFTLRSQSGNFVNPTTIDADISNLRRVTSDELGTRLAASDQLLRSTIGTISAEPKLLHELAHQDLVDQGLKLLDDTGMCPLCQTAFPAGELRRKLETRLASAQEASRLKKQVEKAVLEIAEVIDFVLPSLGRVLAVAVQIGASSTISSLGGWQKQLEALKQSLHQPIQNYLHIDDQVTILFSPSNLDTVLVDFSGVISSAFPQTSPEQTAYDRLTQIETLLSTWNIETGKYRIAETAIHHAQALHSAFLEARDKILGNLYLEIRQRFEDLYRQLHGTDEASFASMLEPDDAGLNFKVDFHGRGMHPPHALHSEGHQDSMGICLFLALAERLTKGKFDITLLDDIVMSVDSGHRKDLCRVLKDQFRDRQFI
jgi:recombinational DNA repair ATPase RecF